MASRRSLQIALGLSLAVHAVLLLAPLVPTSPTADASLLPDLRVWIRAAADRELDAEADDAMHRDTPPAGPRIARPAATGSSPAASDRRPRDAGAGPSAAASTAPSGSPSTAAAPLAVPSPAAAAPMPQVPLEAATADGGPASTAQHEFDDGPTPGVVLPTDERRRFVARVEALAGEFAAAPGTRVAQWREDGRRYSAVIERGPSAGLDGHEKAIVDVTTEQDGRELRTRLRLKRLAFSHYTQLVDRWDEQVQLHDDEIAGRFHSNSPIVVGWDGDAAPRFLGRVTTASNAGFRVVDASRQRARRELFRGGLETGVPRVELRRQALYAGLAAAGPAEVRTFATSASIEFLADGGFEWWPDGAAGDLRREPPVAQALHLLAGPGAELRVRGVVRGTVLVYSPERIVISGNLRYARTAGDAEPQGVLGLVSDADVVVAGPQVTGAGDLTVEAAIFARRQFVVREPRHRDAATLHVYGSLAAGSIAETEPRYATRLRFDPRLEDARPPGFPVTDRFEALPWEETWAEAGP